MNSVVLAPLGDGDRWRKRMPVTGGASGVGVGDARVTVIGAANGCRSPVLPLGLGDRQSQRMSVSVVPMGALVRELVPSGCLGDG